MSEIDRDLPSLSNFAWQSKIVYQLGLFWFFSILALFQVPIPMQRHVSPGLYFRILPALILGIVVLVFLDWRRHVRDYRETHRYPQTSSMERVRVLSDEEEAELGGSNRMSTMAIVYNFVAFILNFFMLATTPFPPS